MRKRLLIAGVAVLIAADPLLPILCAAPARAAVAQGGGAASLLGDFSLGSRKEPITVNADTLEFSYRDRVLNYQGNVVVTQGDLTLRSNSLRVTFNDDLRDRLEEVVAVGDVHITKGARTASGGKAVFNQRDRTIQLSDNAVLLDGPNRISGERVVVYLDEERSVVEGGDRRVQAVLYPNENDAGHAGTNPGSAEK